MFNKVWGVASSFLISVVQTAGGCRAPVLGCGGKGRFFQTASHRGKLGFWGKFARVPKSGHLRSALFTGTALAFLKFPTRGHLDTRFLSLPPPGAPAAGLPPSPSTPPARVRACGGGPAGFGGNPFGQSVGGFESPAPPKSVPPRRGCARVSLPTEACSSSGEAGITSTWQFPSAYSQSTEKPSVHLRHFLCKLLFFFFKTTTKQTTGMSHIFPVGPLWRVASPIVMWTN